MESLPTPVDLAYIPSRVRGARIRTLGRLSRFDRYAAPATLLREVWHRHGRREAWPLAVERRHRAGVLVLGRSLPSGRRPSALASVRTVLVVVRVVALGFASSRTSSGYIATNMAARRPLPVPPGPPDLMAASPYYSPGPYPYPSTFFPQHHYDQETYGGASQFKTTLPGGTLLHKGFYDLLAMIPTPSPSRFLLGATGASPPPAPPPDRLVAGPRYETIRPGKPPMPPPAPAPQSPAYSPPSSPATPRRGRRISKDMVSNPTGFVYVTCSKQTKFVHAQHPL